MSTRGGVTIEAKKGIIKVIVNSNSPKNKIICFDSSKDAYRINIKAKAEDNKANKELLRFLSKELKKKVRIKSGFCSKEKRVSIE